MGQSAATTTVSSCRTVVAVDTETCLIRPGRQAPPLVCLTRQVAGQPPEIYGVDEAHARLYADLHDPAYTFVGHNIAFDFAVIAARYPDLIPAIFAAYDADRVTDTMLRQQLLDIAAGCFRGRADSKGKWTAYGYTLDEVSRRVAGVPLKKTGFRMFYAAFEGVALRSWDAWAGTVQAAARRYLDPLDPQGLEVHGLSAEFDEAAAILGTETLRTELLGLIAAAPTEARTYALDDAAATLAVYRAQAPHEEKYLADQYRQARAYFALALSSAWGLRSDGDGAAVLRRETEAQLAYVFARLLEAGLARPDGSRDTKTAKRLMLSVCAAAGTKPRRTAAHATPQAKCKARDGTPLPPGHDDCAEHVELSGDACNATEDDVLADYAELSTLGKVLANDVKMLEQATHLPVHPRYGLAETGRTTCSRPNLQNVSKRPGIREAFVARPGYVFAAADFPSLELYTLAQCCVAWLGRSALAEALKSGLDPHTAMAAQMLKVEYSDALARLAAGDKEAKDMRQMAKVANFGFPGGMGVKTLIKQTKKQLGQVDRALLARLEEKGFLTEERMTKLKQEWFSTWPEMPAYFASINAKMVETPAGPRATVTTLYTQRVRGNATYCAACNNGFQALGSDCAKSACWNITRSVYTDREGPLYGSRVVAFVHDEFIAEVPEARAHEAAFGLAAAMADGANVYLPDVPIPLAKVQPVLMRRWSKKAEQRWNAEGRLCTWD